MAHAHALLAAFFPRCPKCQHQTHTETPPPAPAPTGPVYRLRVCPACEWFEPLLAVRREVAHAVA